MEESQLEQARKTGLLHLSLRNLHVIPNGVFELPKLVRLDLGFNNLTTVPDAIGQLVALEALWLNNNPLTSISPEICHCTNLKELDLKETSITKLPYSLGRLKKVTMLNVENVLTLQSQMATAPEGIIAYLKKRDVRRMLKSSLFEKLRDTIYREIASTNDGEARIWKVVKSTLKEFSNNDEIKSLIRNAERLFAAEIDENRPASVRSDFVSLRREVEKKKLGADLELCIRRIYFDRIDPQIVEGMVKDIYLEIQDLENVKFLIKHAVSLFPPSATDVDGMTLHDNLVQLQQQLAAEREAAVKVLFSAVSGIYSDAEPHLVQTLVTNVSELFKKSKDLKTLASDAAYHFPTEIFSASAKKVKASFIEKRKKMMVG